MFHFINNWCKFLTLKKEIVLALFSPRTVKYSVQEKFKNTLGEVLPQLIEANGYKEMKGNSC